MDHTKDIEIRFLTQQEIPDATRLFTKSFIYGNNPIWKTLNPNPNQVQLYQGMFQRVKLSQSQNLLNGLFHQGKLIGAACGYLIKDYIEMGKHQSKAQVLNLIGKHGKILQKQLYETQHAQNTIYLAYLAILPQHAGHSYAQYYFSESLRGIGNSGFKFGYSRASNPITKRLSLLMGAIQMNSLKILNTQDGKQYQFTLFKHDLPNTLTYEQMQAKKKQLTKK